MTDARDVVGDDAECEVPTDVIRVHRRRLLETAAGGFALAAHGLLLPVQLLEDAEARTKPVRRIEGRNEQRHRKRHHQNRHHHPQQGNTSESDRPPTGSVGLLNVALRIDNRRGTVLSLGVYGPKSSTKSLNGGRNRKGRRSPRG